MKALTVKQLRDALTKLMETNPKTENYIVVTADAEDYEHFIIPEDVNLPCGNFLRDNDGTNLFLTEDDCEDDVEYEENAVCISY